MQTLIFNNTIIYDVNHVISIIVNINFFRRCNTWRTLVNKENLTFLVSSFINYYRINKD